MYRLLFWSERWMWEMRSSLMCPSKGRCLERERAVDRPDAATVRVCGPYVATVMTIGRRGAGAEPPSSVSSAPEDRKLVGAERLQYVALSQAEIF
jgi:hypothetical protein